MTTINVVSGFLGAGKTTLLRKVIEEVFNGQRLVLVENEFGTVGIDGTFIKDTGVELSEISSGCICCSMSGDFTGQLQTLIEWETPEQILIEPSGVAKLSDIRRSIRQVQKACRDDEVIMGNAVTVVDAARCASYIENFGEFYLDQIQQADSVILSHTNNLTDDVLQKCLELLQSYNREASIITTPWQQLPTTTLRQLFTEKVNPEKQTWELWRQLPVPTGLTRKKSYLGTPSRCRNANEMPFLSWGLETPRHFTYQQLEKILAELEPTCGAGNVLRAKGSVAGEAGNWYQFDFLPGEYQIRESAAETTGRICVIGTQLNEEALMRIFQG